MPAGTAQLALANTPMTVRGFLRAWFGAVAQRVRAQRALRAEQRRAATLATADRDATRLYWRD